jgi:IS30 family transposase
MTATFVCCAAQFFVTFSYSAFSSQLSGFFSSWKGHKLPHVSDERKRHEQTIRQLASKGMSIRAIARQLGVNRGVVQRVLESDIPVQTLPADTPGDYAEVNDEFQAKMTAAHEGGGIAVLRDLHHTARVCYDQGYRVRYSPLRLLMALSALQPDASAADRKAIRTEISAVYQWMRDNHVGNYAHPMYGGNGDRGGVEEFTLED